MTLTDHQRQLDLKHPWTIARGTSASKTYGFVELTEDGVTGWGEAAHNVRYGESLESIQAALQAARPILETADPWQFHHILESLKAAMPSQHAALAALDIALLDWVGKKLGIPLYRYLGLRPAPLPQTSVSIGIDEPDSIAKKIAEVADFPFLKVKLGTGSDEAIMAAVRDSTNQIVRVDANEGWTTKEVALEKCEWLAGQNVEFVEQPMPAGSLDDLRWLRERSPLPLVADEDVKTASDLPALVGAYDGVNLKLMKAGGIQETLRMIHVARALGLQIMLGCMIESSLGITAAAHLAPLVDWLDLDGNLLIANDPFLGATCQAGTIILPDRPGIGVLERSELRT